MSENDGKELIGYRFKTREVEEFKIGTRIIANYLPEHDYRVTDLNCAYVAGLIAEDKAGVTGFAKAGRAGGSVTVK